MSRLLAKRKTIQTWNLAHILPLTLSKNGLFVFSKKSPWLQLASKKCCVTCIFRIFPRLPCQGFFFLFGKQKSPKYLYSLNNASPIKVISTQYCPAIYNSDRLPSLFLIVGFHGNNLGGIPWKNESRYFSKFGFQIASKKTPLFDFARNNF